MQIQPFFDNDTATFTYVVSDPASGQCAVIDPVLDYDMHAGRTGTASSDRVIAHIRAHGLKLAWILETHAHADHLSGAKYLQRVLGGKIGIGEHIREVLAFWVPLLDTGHDTPLDGSQFDHLFRDGERFRIGGIDVQVLHTPGHTPACVSYLMGDAAFIGDTLFMPERGTARTDFPGGSAATLYRSIRKLLSLPAQVRLYTGHDYPPEGQTEQAVATVAEHNAGNRMAHQGITEADYVAARNARDASLAVPRLLLPSIQVNLRAGGLGQAAANGTHYLKIPLDKL